MILDLNLVFNTHLLQYFLDSNEDTYLKIHYDMDTLPEERSTLPKFKSDVCKWHLFISNITEDVFHVLQQTFTLDYSRELKFQVHSEQQEIQPSQSFSIPASASDNTLSGSFQLSILPYLLNLC